MSRFFSVDPIASQYPELTTYQFASNTPIQAIDLDGLEGVRHYDSPNIGEGFGGGISYGRGAGAGIPLTGWQGTALNISVMPARVRRSFLPPMDRKAPPLLGGNGVRLPPVTSGGIWSRTKSLAGGFFSGYSAKAMGIDLGLQFGVGLATGKSFTDALWDMDFFDGWVAGGFQKMPLGLAWRIGFQAGADGKLGGVSVGGLNKPLSFVGVDIVSGLFGETSAGLFKEIGGGWDEYQRRLAKTKLMGSREKGLTATHVIEGWTSKATKVPEVSIDYSLKYASSRIQSFIGGDDDKKSATKPTSQGEAWDWLPKANDNTRGAAGSILDGAKDRFLDNNK